MKKLRIGLISFLSVFLVACSSSQTSGTTMAERSSSVNVNQSEEVASMVNSKIIFVNASRNKDGNTVQMAEKMLEGIKYEQVNLVDYNIAFLGQEDMNDEFQDFLTDIEGAETIVIGTPVYWHSMSGSLKTCLLYTSDAADD